MRHCLKKTPLYPFLFSIFPILSLASYNIHEIFVSAVLRPLIASLLLSAAIYGLAYLITRESARAALIASIALLLFFSYGHIYDAVEDLTIGSASLFRHRTLAPALALLALVLIFLAWRARNPGSFTFSANVISVVLLVFPLLTITSYLIRQFNANRAEKKTTALASVPLDKNAPDIYYIILDAYGRQDVLRNRVGYDNTPFLDALRQRGFYIGTCSQSNYGYTEYSLASSLNYDYLDVLGGVDNTSRIALIKHGAVRSFFESLGYKTIAFPTGWSSTEWKDADFYYDYGGGFTTLTEFEKLFIDTTLLRVQADYNRSNASAADKRDARRLRVLSALDKLKQIPGKPEHTFTFAHLVIPHNPYSFGPNGEFVSFNEDAPFEDHAQAYANQVIFINREILNVVDVILQKSDVPPVIIIQGDHGPLPDISITADEKMPILNAYYLPGTAAQQLYPTITPVNSFRVVLNSLFHQTLPLLKDISYYAPKNDRENFEVIPNTCQP